MKTISATRLRKLSTKRVLGTSCAIALLALMAWTPEVQAYPSYDNGAGQGCVSCHNGFVGGPGIGPLHNQHLQRFGIATCAVCHTSSSGGTTPVDTYTSGSGYGCAGCHGVDYGETSPNSGQPKATSYGLRLFHVSQGVTSCGTSGCHQPGSLGSPNPFPAVEPESTAPPYYAPLYSALTNPCWNTEEDLPFDLDSAGLDNDGDGLADYPADPDCLVAPPTTTSTTTTTLPVGCGAAPEPEIDCIAAGKAVLSINEKTAGKEKLKISLTKLVPTVSQSDFGNPSIGGTTGYSMCVYDSSNQLVDELIVDRAGDVCDGSLCWSSVSTKGYKYSDKATTADGILKMTLSGGDPGKGKAVILGKNDASNGQTALPTGKASALQSSTSATIQVLTTNGECFSATLTQVKKADGTVFTATTP